MNFIYLYGFRWVIHATWHVSWERMHLLRTIAYHIKEMKLDPASYCAQKSIPSRLKKLKAFFFFKGGIL